MYFKNSHLVLSTFIGVFILFLCLYILGTKWYQIDFFYKMLLFGFILSLALIIIKIPLAHIRDIKRLTLLKKEGVLVYGDIIDVSEKKVGSYNMNILTIQQEKNKKIYTVGPVLKPKENLIYRRVSLLIDANDSDNFTLCKIEDIFEQENIEKYDSMTLKNYIHKIFVSCYKSIPQKELNDIYAFSFWIHDDCDDPRYPVLTIGYNTISHCNEVEHKVRDPREVKWNYAFWLHNNLRGIGTKGDKIGRGKIVDLFKNEGLYYTDEEYSKNPDNYDKKMERMTEEFVSITIEVVKDIHKELELNIPIIIHELEYYHEIINQNIIANGEKRVKEFTEYYNSVFI